MQSQTPQKTHLMSVVYFYALACALTWSLGIWATLSFLKGTPPTPLETAGAGLSAFGPLIAATALSHREGSLKSLFRLRTDGPWLRMALLAFAAPMALRLLASALTALFGFELSQWVYAPTAWTQVAAFIVFPLGEECGWRGFAYPRLRQRFGLVKGSLIVGVMWSLWHLGYMADMKTGEVDWIRQVESLISLPLYSVILTWFFERGRGNFVVAIVFHVSGLLNHVEMAPVREVGFHVMHLAVVGLAAWFAARSLQRRGIPVTQQDSRRSPNTTLRREATH